MKQYLRIIVSFLPLLLCCGGDSGRGMGSLEPFPTLTAYQESMQNLGLMFVCWSICEFYERESKSVHWDVSYCMVALRDATYFLTKAHCKWSQGMMLCVVRYFALYKYSHYYYF